MPLRLYDLRLQFIDADGQVKHELVPAMGKNFSTMRDGKAVDPKLVNWASPGGGVMSYGKAEEYAKREGYRISAQVIHVNAKGRGFPGSYN